MNEFDLGKVRLRTRVVSAIFIYFSPFHARFSLRSNDRYKFFCKRLLNDTSIARSVSKGNSGWKKLFLMCQKRETIQLKLSKIINKHKNLNLFLFFGNYDGSLNLETNLN